MSEIICRAINRKGESISYKRYHFNPEIETEDACSYALEFFIRELKEVSKYADQTVRITIDIALPERWYDVSE